MKRIDELWTILENDDTVNSIGLRRYSGTVLPDVFVAVRGREKIRCIATSLSNTREPNLSLYDNLEDIELEILPHVLRNDKNLLLIKLVNSQHTEIFSILCEDLIRSISFLTDEEEVIERLFNRLENWKSLFDKASLEGLNGEEQSGLFGELFFLRKYLLNDNDYLKVINSWLGPQKEIRDFQFKQWAVEVKTSKGNNHQTIIVSNERQLDTTNISSLFLYHLSLQVLNNSGENLNQIVEEINTLLQRDIISLNRFENKLLEGGYFKYHKNIYNETGYALRQENFYKVEGDFPRIEERDIRNGIGEVKYSIILSQCSSFIIPEKEVFKTISIHV